MTGARILVTGAGGFIGGAVSARLAEAGRPVARGARAPGAGDIPCDLDDPAQVASAMSEVGAIVHAAVGPADRMVPQLRVLLDAASRAGIGRIVHFSSIAVYGDRDAVVTEADGPIGRLDAYAAGKRACEALVEAWVSGAAPDAPRRAILLRPGIVYGAGSRFWIDRLSLRIRSGGWGVFAEAGEGIASLIHIDDVAGGTLRALDHLAGPAAAEAVALNLIGPDQPTWNGYFQALAEGLGAGPLRAIGRRELAWRQALSLPLKLAARAGAPVPASLAMTPLPAEMRLFARAATYSTAQAEDVLAWRARVTLREGLARSLPRRP